MGDERVHQGQLARQQARIAPQLGRPFVTHLTPQALAAVASFAVVPPLHVRRHTSQCSCAKYTLIASWPYANRPGPPINDTLLKLTTSNALRENAPQLPAVDDGTPDLMGEKRADQRHRRAQRDQPHAERIRGLVLRERLVAQNGERVGVVHDRDLVAAFGERARHSLDGEAVAAEVESVDKRS
jgi:hypothetical protein